MSWQMRQTNEKWIWTSGPRQYKEKEKELALGWYEEKAQPTAVMHPLPYTSLQRSLGIAENGK